MNHETIQEVSSHVAGLLADGYSIPETEELTSQWAESIGLPVERKDILNYAEIAIRSESATPRSENARKEQPRPLRRQIGNPQEFPTKALGPILGAAAQALYDRVQAPLSMCGSSVLAVASLAAQAQANVQIDDRIHPLSLFMLTISDSGSRKSSVDNKAMAPVSEYEDSLEAGYRVDWKQYVDELEAYEIARNNAKKQGKSVTRDAIRRNLEAVGDAPAPPLKPFLTAEEPNYEGLFRLFDEGQPSMGIFSSEGGRMVGGYSMREENKLNMAAGLSAFWDGQKVKRVRAGDGATSLNGKRLSMHLMIQPKAALRLLGDSDLKDQGLLARCLVSYPESMAGERLYRESGPDDDHRIVKYSQAIRRLLLAPRILREGTRNELDPRPLHLSPVAKQAWIGFYDEVERKTKADKEFSGIAAFASKAAEQALRISGILALVSDPHTSTIDETDIFGGIALTTFYINEALRMVDACSVSPEVEKAESLLTWLSEKWVPEKGPIVPLAAIYQRGPASLREAKPAKAAIKVLVDHGWCIGPMPAEFEGNPVREAWEVVNCV